jgi:hypothetical protein
MTYTYAVTDRHLTSILAYAEVRQRQISDAAAVTIASWWQAPSNRALTSLASGLPTDMTDVAYEAGRELDEWRQHEHSPRDVDGLALELLIGWAEQRYLEAAAKAGDLTRAGLVKAASGLKSVDYQGMLPAEAGNYTGEPNDRVFRQSVISKPDPAAPTKVTMVKEFFTGDTAKDFEFTQPCFG